MTNHPLPAATLQKTGSLTFGLKRLSRDIGAALLTRAGGVMFATAAVLGMGALPLPTQAGGFPVTKLADTADGTCDTDCSLREAIAATNASIGADTIIFASSVTGTITLDIATHGNLDITDELVITGPGAGQLAISGGNVAPGTENGGIFNATSGASLTTITGLTLTNGNSTRNGGAIYVYDGLALDDVTIQASHAGDVGGGFIVIDNVVLTSSTVSGNTAYSGGGFFVGHGNATLTDSSVIGNVASFNGGGFFLEDGDVTLANSVVSDNEASNLGGGFMAGDAVLTNITVSGNTAGANGGGFLVFGGGTATLTSSTVSGNTADFGGGFIVLGVDGHVSLTNSTVSGNDAREDGGGFYVDGDATVINSTVSDNTAYGTGGGVAVDDNATLSNSIVSGNTASSNPDVWVNSVYAVFASYSLIGIYEGTYTDNGGNIIGSGSASADPLLGPLADNGGPTWTHALGADSPALDAGSNALAAGLDYDQRGPGYPRIISGTVDMGAFERSDRIFFDGFE